MIIPMNSDLKRTPLSDTAQDEAGELEDFIYVLSHDVRSSVRALLELPQWIKEDLIEAGHTIEGSLDTNFELMNTHMSRLDQMLIDLLDYSRVGRKQSIQVIDLETATDHVMNQIDMPSGFQLIRDLQCKTIHMGEKDITVLLRALLSNAIKHHTGGVGQVKFSTRLDGFECVMAFQDDGPGIPEKHRSSVFDTMKTLKPRDEVEGSGMGLATVRKIVQYYDGHIAWTDGIGGNGIGAELRFPI